MRDGNGLASILAGNGRGSADHRPFALFALTGGHLFPVVCTTVPLVSGGTPASAQVVRRPPHGSGIRPLSEASRDLAVIRSTYDALASAATGLLRDSLAAPTVPVSVG